MILFWPACLCFCSETSLKPGRRSADHSGFIKNEDIDPLLFAESWFLAGASRVEEIETKRKNDEFEALKLKDSLDVDDKDSFAELALRTNQHPSTLEANSIYPTPPDGLRLQGVGSSVKPLGQPSSGATGNEDNLNNVDDSLLNDSPFATSTGPGISSISYQPEVDNLFGEMDSEMFTADGLTEADFSFFDEPTTDADVEMLNNQEINGDGTDVLEICEPSLAPILLVQNVAVANSTLHEPITGAEQARVKTMVVQGSRNPKILFHLPSIDTKLQRPICKMDPCLVTSYSVRSLHRMLCGRSCCDYPTQVWSLEKNPRPVLILAKESLRGNTTSLLNLCPLKTNSKDLIANIQTTEGLDTKLKIRL